MGGYTPAPLYPLSLSWGLDSSSQPDSLEESRPSSPVWLPVDFVTALATGISSSIGLSHKVLLAMCSGKSSDGQIKYKLLKTVTENPRCMSNIDNTTSADRLFNCNINTLDCCTNLYRSQVKLCYYVCKRGMFSQDQSLKELPDSGTNYRTNRQ